MLSLLALLACGPGHRDEPAPTTVPDAAPDAAPAAAPAANSTTLQNKGSDTMVNVAQAWAEEYHNVHGSVAIAVSGGGSGTGVAALENSTADIANASRELKADEKAKILAAFQKEAVEHTVAYDAIAIYVHKDNPLTKINKAQIAAIYGEKGATEKWSDLGVQVPGCSNGSIVRISRQNNSGTYEYFREWTLDKGDFKLGSRDMQGSKDVVDAVSTTPCAIGYSGMGYKSAEVRFVPVSLDDVVPAIEPSIAAVHDHTYPISRALYMDTVGEATGEAGRYIQWIQSSVGQGFVEKAGLVPLPLTEQKPAPI